MSSRLWGSRPSQSLVKSEECLGNFLDFMFTNHLQLPSLLSCRSLCSPSVHPFLPAPHEALCCWTESPPGQGCPIGCCLPTRSPVEGRASQPSPFSSTVPSTETPFLLTYSPLEDTPDGLQDNWVHNTPDLWFLITVVICASNLRSPVKEQAAFLHANTC